MPGKIILLTGASSSGTSYLAQAVQARAALPFWHYSIDHLKAGGVLPLDRIRGEEFAWSSMRQDFFEGFHRSIPAFAQAGNNLLVEHIIEERTWMDRLLFLLADHDVFFVGLHCPLEELERREIRRGDRPRGDARTDAAITHTFGEYDLEIETTIPVTEQAIRLIDAWEARCHPSAFSRMAGRGSTAGAA